MNCDGAMSIGKTHRMAQDYVRYNRHYHRTTEKGVPVPPSTPPYVVLADGCSEDVLWLPPYGNDTDWGARILCQMAERFIFSDTSRFYPSVLQSASACLNALGLYPTALDATLMTAALIEREGKQFIRCTTYGDGFVAAKKKNGEIEIIKTTFVKYPYYLSYSLDEQRKAAMLAKCGGTNPRSVTHLTYGPNGLIVPPVTEQFPEPHGEYAFPVEDYEFVAIMSDGVATFYRYGPNGAKVERNSLDVVVALMNHQPSYDGEFAQRTLNGFLRRCARDGYSHSDDVSLGVIYTGE